MNDAFGLQEIGEEKMSFWRPREIRLLGRSSSLSFSLDIKNVYVEFKTRAHKSSINGLR